MHKALWAFTKGCIVGTVLIFIFVALFVAIWGWHRFVLDFWPLDSSRIGPNLVASIVTIVLVTAHNEARIVQKSELKGEDLRQLFDDMREQVIHPIEQLTDSVSDAVVDKLEDKEKPS